MLQRTVYTDIWKELIRDKSMVFLSGPRQAGKTTLAEMVAETYVNKTYLNWDILEHRERLLRKPAFFEDINRKDDSRPLVIMDEIHKYHNWKNYLKGIYDRYHKEFTFFILGSGRLDTYRKGGDSLAGRYFMFHLWPVTVAETAGRVKNHETFFNNPLALSDTGSPVISKTWETLNTVGGFPEPYLSGKKAFYRRWFRTYRHQLIREDIRDMTGVKNIDTMELLFSLLPSKIGSPLSVANLARDLQVSHPAVSNWLSLFESFFLIFKIAPWSDKISRALTKEKKYYLYNYPEIGDEAARFENMVAVELHRAVNNWTDLGYGQYGMHYIRNKEKEEVDFLITRERRPFLLVEVKLRDTQPSKPLRHFQTALRIPSVQLTGTPGIQKLMTNGDYKILVKSAWDWLAGLP